MDHSTTLYIVEGVARSNYLGNWTPIENDLLYNLENKIYSKIPYELECPICLEIVPESVTWNSCSHKFCESCFNKINTCAMCRKPWMNFDPDILKYGEEFETLYKTYSYINVGFTKKDVEFVIFNTNVSEDAAYEALKASHGDVINAIMNIIY